MRKINTKKRNNLPKDSVERFVDRVCVVFGLTKYRIFLRQVTKFVIVGFFNTVIDWLIFYILTSFTNLNPLFANIVSYSVATIYNFFASTRFVFRTTKQKTMRRLFVEFVVQNIFGFAISESLLYVLIDKIKIADMLAKIITTGIVMIFDFVTRKIILEDRHKKRRVK